MKDGEGEGQKGSQTLCPKNHSGMENQNNQNELSEVMFFGCMKTYFMNESSFLRWGIDGSLERSESHGGFPEFTLYTALVCS